MLKFLLPALRGAIALTLLVCNTLFWCTLLLVLALVKLLLPLPGVRRQIDPLLNRIASGWVACNTGWMRLTQGTTWDVAGVADLDAQDWYLVNCNHQSWVDILVLQRVLNRRIPLLKFFLKRELIYVPVIGLAWWALDFPFLRRQTKGDLRRNPNLRLADREATLRACERFARLPTSVISFAEGTRFTPAKHRGSPYRHLLKPKAGALALTLGAMGAQFHAMLDVTIVYPAGAPDFWTFLTGRVPRIIVRVRKLPIPPDFSGGDYAQDRVFRRSFHQWLEAIWDYKDQEIGALLGQDQQAMVAVSRRATPKATTQLTIRSAVDKDHAAVASASLSFAPCPCISRLPKRPHSTWFVPPAVCPHSRPRSTTARTASIWACAMRPMRAISLA